jgi:tryptophanyl-tRNA synthetase
MKKVLLSGSTTTGFPTIGNYIGAISNWAKLQDEYDCYYMVADLHALTVKQDPKVLRERILSFFGHYIACGLDPDKNVIFMQSHVPAHGELTWLLNCYTPMGALNRMTQFKEKSAQTKEINSGLYTYPVLMAADILLYQTDLVPVGEDQKQHLELARDLAESFNKKFGQTFKIPEPYIPKVGARIMSLQDPTKKMSKSDTDANNYIALLDPPKKIEKKIKSAMTDSDPNFRIVYDVENKAGISNLMVMYSVLTGKTFVEIEKAYEGKMYGAFKGDLAQIIIEALKPVQDKYEQLMKDPGELNSILKRNSQRAMDKANPTLKNAYDKIGLYTLK